MQPTFHGVRRSEALSLSQSPRNVTVAGAVETEYLPVTEHDGDSWWHRGSPSHPPSGHRLDDAV